MATVVWRGSALAVAQVTTITFSAYTSGVTYSVTINGKTLSFTATASTLANVIDGLVAAIDATTEPEFKEFTATNDSGLVCTGNTLGMPFTITASTDGAPTPTVTPTTAPTGPNHFDNAQNWEGGAVPSAADDLVFRNSSVGMWYALEDTGTNYGDITVESTYTGTIGLPATNAAGYREYRPRFLKLGDGTSAFAVTIGQGIGGQSSRIQIDANAGTVTGRIYATGSSQTDIEPVVLKNTDAASTIDVYSGQVRLDADTSGSMANLRITPAEGQQGARVIATDTVACGAIVMGGGELECRGSATSLEARGGAIIYFTLASTCPTITVSDSAIVFWSSTAGITTDLIVGVSGQIDFSQNAGAKTVTDCEVHSGGIVSDPLGVVTWTDGLQINEAKLGETQIDIGRGFKITPS